MIGEWGRIGKDSVVACIHVISEGKHIIDKVDKIQTQYLRIQIMLYMRNRSMGFCEKKQMFFPCRDSNPVSSSL